MRRRSISPPNKRPASPGRKPTRRVSPLRKQSLKQEPLHPVHRSLAERRFLAYKPIPSSIDRAYESRLTAGKAYKPLSGQPLLSRSKRSRDRSRDKARWHRSSSKGRSPPRNLLERKRSPGYAQEQRKNSNRHSYSPESNRSSTTYVKSIPLDSLKYKSNPLASSGLASRREDPFGYRPSPSAGLGLPSRASETNRRSPRREDSPRSPAKSRWEQEVHVWLVYSTCLYFYLLFFVASKRRNKLSTYGAKIF